jgi:hypothetical protein
MLPQPLAAELAAPLIANLATFNASRRNEASRGVGVSGSNDVRSS